MKKEKRFYLEGKFIDSETSNEVKGDFYPSFIFNVKSENSEQTKNRIIKPDMAELFHENIANHIKTILEDNLNYSRKHMGITISEMPSSESIEELLSKLNKIEQNVIELEGWPGPYKLNLVIFRDFYNSETYKL